MKGPSRSILLALALAPSCLFAQPRFIQTSPERVMLPDGTPLAAATDQTPWQWLPGEGNGGILESRAHEQNRNAPPLRLIIDDCTPHADYEVFGYFWAPGFGDQPNQRNLKHWPARFGFGLATLTTYGGKPVERVPWIISLDSEVGRFAGLASTLEESDPLPGLDLITADGDARLIRARIGVARADAAGTLMVYLDDFPESIHCEKTRIDGIAIQPAPKDADPTAGTGDSLVLHLAIRANDWPSAQHELDAGAEINALDPRELSVLFHPASAGDVETLEKLLAAGADPNLPGQALLPLAGAASTGSIDAVRLLLAAGAEVPATRLEMPAIISSSPPRRNQGHALNDLALLHPAIAAIRAGSLATLQILLEQRPDLDLEALSNEDDGHYSYVRRDNLSRYLIEDAMNQGHDELAAFLIDRGCALTAASDYFGDYWPVTRPYALLAYAICAEPMLEKSVTALLRRGVSPIRKLGPQNYSQMAYRHGIEPWDGLSAAVATANVQLTQRFLLDAQSLPLFYEELLLAMARWHGEPRILSMIEQAFPDAGKHPFQPSSQQSQTQDTQALRLLLPRVKPSPLKPRPEDSATLTLAVIASPNAGGEAAALEAVASTDHVWTVVDRMDVDTALRESQIADLWAGGEFRFAELGDRMAADLIVLVSRIDGEEMKLLRFEVIDIASGLAVWREHLDASEFDPEKTAGPFLQRAHAAMLSARAGDRPTAITLLPFSIDSTLWNGQSMLSVFRSAVQAEIDAAPGLLTVGMNEIRAIGGEQALGGEGSFWAAAYTLEGGVTAHEGDQVSVTLRMRSMREGETKPIDHTERGHVNEIPTLATRAWHSMAANPEFFDAQATAHATSPDAAQVAAEAARLLREAEWLNAMKLYAEAEQLLDRANVLGADPQALVFAHYHALVHQVPFFPPLGQGSNAGVPITPHPLTLRHQAVLFASLDAAQNLLDQMAYYLSRFGPESMSWRNQRFNQTLMAVCYMRACIPAVLPEGVSPEVVAHFCQSVDRYTQDYFKIRLSAKVPQMQRSGADIRGTRYREYLTAAMLRRNPELLDGWLSLFLINSTATETSPYYLGLFHMLMAGGDPLLYGKKQLLLDAIAKRIDELPADQRTIRDVELAYLSSRDEAHTAAARAYSEELTRQGLTQWYLTRAWVKPTTVFERFGITLLGQTHENPWVIPAIIHEPRGHNDWISQAGYNWVIHNHARIETMPPREARTHFARNQSFRSWSSTAEQASKTDNPRQAVATVYHHAGNWELTYGRTLREALEKHTDRLFLPKEEHPDTILRPQLLVDFRQLDPNMPGMLYMPTVDRRNKNRLWLFYQPYEQKPDPSFSYDAAVRRHPKIVAVDCDSGEIQVTADVAKAPGILSDPSGRYSLGMHHHYYNFFAQTNDLILTSIPWPRDNSGDRAWPQVGMLIRKDNGTFIPLNPQVEIKELFDLVNGTFGAIPVGDQFISAIWAERSGIRTGNSSLIPHELIRIDPDGTVTELTQYGRRPELTPFDPIDRSARMLVPDGNRALVLHSWQHASRFNPKENAWEPLEETPEELKKNVTRKVTRDYQHHIFSCNRIRESDGVPRITIDWAKTFHDMLAVSERGGKLLRLPVHLDLPPGLADELVFSHDARGERVGNRSGPLVPYRHHQGTDRFTIVVVHQTNTHLILAKQVGRGFKWTIGRRAGEFLPVLWSLPIKDVQNAFMAQNP